MSSKSKPTNGVEPVAAAAEKVENIAESAAERVSAAAPEAQDRVAAAYDGFVSLNRRGVEAVVQKASTTVKCLEAINTEVLSFAKSSIEDSVEAGRAMMGVRSVQDLMDVQTRYARNAFERFVDCSTKLNDMMVTASKEALQPIDTAFAKGTHASA